MRRIAWLGGAALIALAAIPLWLVLDDGGERRLAAVNAPPSANADIGRLTIVGVNGGAPIGIRGFRLIAKFEPGSTVARGFEIDKSIDALSPVLYNMLFQQPNDPSETKKGKLELLTGGRPYMTYDLNFVVLDDWTTGMFGKQLDSFRFNSGVPEGKHSATTTAPVAAESSVVGTLEVPALGGKPVPILEFATSSDHVSAPNADDPPGTPTHEPGVIHILRPLDSLAGAMLATLNGGTLASVKGDRRLEKINVSLIEPGGAIPYAMYTFEQVKIEAVSDSAASGSIATQELTLSYKDFEMKIGGNAAGATG